MSILKKKYTGLFIFIGACILVLLGLFLFRLTPETSSQATTVKDQTATIPLQKTLSIPVPGDSGNVATTLKYTIESAEFNNEIIYNGDIHSAGKGKRYLILSIKIESQFTKAIDLKPQNFLRLSMNGNDAELYTADLYTDPLQILSQSTKRTTLTYLLNETDKDLVLHLGGTNLPKQKIPLR